MQQLVFAKPVVLNDSHLPLLQSFDCGIEALNRWFLQRALENQKNRASRTYVSMSNAGDIAGFYCLSNAVLSHNRLTSRHRRNMPNPISCCLLGRLAVDKKYQGFGLGPNLLIDAIRRTADLSLISGCWALIVQPKGEQQIGFYEHFGFVRCKQEQNEDPLMFFELRGL